jgi:hypothetical protein
VNFRANGKYHTKIRIIAIFCAVSDAAVASDTENHVCVNRPYCRDLALLAPSRYLGRRELAPTHKLAPSESLKNSPLTPAGGGAVSIRT